MEREAGEHRTDVTASVGGASSHHRVKRGTLLTVVFTSYFMVCGGPFGVESILAAGPSMAIALLALFPFVYGIPFSLIVGELACMHPKNGSNFIWVEHALGPQFAWFVSIVSIPFFIFDLAAYPQLFVGYFSSALCPASVSQQISSTPTLTAFHPSPTRVPITHTRSYVPHFTHTLTLSTHIHPAPTRTLAPTPHSPISVTRTVDSAVSTVRAAPSFPTSFSTSPHAAAPLPSAPHSTPLPPLHPTPAPSPHLSSPRKGSLPSAEPHARPHLGAAHGGEDEPNAAHNPHCLPVWGRAVGVGLLSAVVLGLAVAGVDAAGVALALLAALVSGPFVVWAFAAFASGNVVWRPWVSEWSPKALMTRPALILNILFWNMSGWDNTSALAGELVRPTDFVVGQLISCGLIVATYLIPLVVAFSVHPEPSGWFTDDGGEAAYNFASGSRLAPIVGSQAFVTVVAVAGMFAASGQFLANLISYAFQLWRRAKDGFYPAVFAVRIPPPGGVCVEDSSSDDDDGCPSVSGGRCEEHGKASDRLLGGGRRETVGGTVAAVAPPVPVGTGGAGSIGSWPPRVRGVDSAGSASGVPLLGPQAPKRNSHGATETSVVTPGTSERREEDRVPDLVVGVQEDTGVANRGAAPPPAASRRPHTVGPLLQRPSDSDGAQRHRSAWAPCATTVASASSPHQASSTPHLAAASSFRSNATRASAYDSYSTVGSFPNSPALLARHPLQCLWPFRCGLSSRPPVVALVACVVSAAVMTIVFDNLDAILVVDNLFATTIVALEILSFVVLRLRAPDAPRPFVAMLPGRAGALLAVPPLLCLVALIGINLSECFSHVVTAVIAGVILFVGVVGYPIWTRGMCWFMGGCAPRTH